MHMDTQRFHLQLKHFFTEHAFFSCVLAWLQTETAVGKTPSFVRLFFGDPHLLGTSTVYGTVVA